MDIIASLLGLVLLSPLFLLVAVLVKVQDGGAVFFLGTRVGKNGQVFKLFKFRSMTANAEKTGPGITTQKDSRVTKIGAILRKTKIDELPQLLNVLLGDMSLVGPRPEDPRYVEKYTATQRDILKVRPGITSAASITYRNEEQLLTGSDWEDQYLNKIMPEKLYIDQQYLATRTVFTDIAMIFRTILAVLK